MNQRPPGHVVVRRTLAASAPAVFRCFADPTLLSRWFYAGDATYCEAESDFQVGGRVRFRMYGPGDAVSEHGGRWIEIAHPHLLRMTWSHEGDSASLVQFEFESAGATTHLVVTHTDIPETMLPLFEYGWAQCLGYLARTLTDEEAD